MLPAPRARAAEVADDISRKGTPVGFPTRRPTGEPADRRVPGPAGVGLGCPGARFLAPTPNAARWASKRALGWVWSTMLGGRCGKPRLWVMGPRDVAARKPRDSPRSGSAVQPFGLAFLRVNTSALPNATAPLALVSPACRAASPGRPTPSRRVSLSGGLSSGSRTRRPASLASRNLFLRPHADRRQVDRSETLPRPSGCRAATARRRSCSCGPSPGRRWSTPS